MLALSYKKRDNTELFKSLEKFDISKIQNFIPLYKKFFALNETNFNNINLNNKSTLNKIQSKISENKYIGTVQKNDRIEKKHLFLKFSPILDPIKYMTGKYDVLLNEMSLPSLKTTSGKMYRENNSAYTDAFFSFLSDKLFQNGFVHGQNFFGTYIGIKQNFYYNVFDDFDYLNDSDYFHKQMNNLFYIDDTAVNVFYGNSRNNKNSLNISKTNLQISVENIAKPIENNLPDDTTKLIFETKLEKSSCKTKNSSSTCSSRSSHTDDSSDDESTDSNFSEESDSSNESNETINAVIQNFPVSIISLELLDDTLDSLISSNKIITINEWKSILFQILFILTTYQAVFQFTHNDLHTNNIMYKKTDKQFLIYFFNNNYYKVPTFGKIFKIIDFGRSIYTFKNEVIYSDSFLKKEDAATQYNFGEFFNKKKKRIEPNFSFDLTRLACSLYDFFVPFDVDERKIKNPIGKLIIKWCRDDQGKNILYKKNGDERYPEFKLYKMIARTVHNHIPSQELKNILFNDFIVSKKKVKKKKIMKIENFVKNQDCS